MNKDKDEVEKVALFDLDGTLAGYEHRLREDLALLRSPGEAEWDVHGADLPAWLENRMRIIRLTPGWWRDLPRLEPGMRVFQEAQRIGFKCQVLTKGPRRTQNAWTEKLHWVQANLGEDVDVTITFDKGLVYGRVLCDDYPPYMDRWLAHRPRGLGIMPAATYNAGYSHPAVVRYDGSEGSWSEVAERLQAAFDRPAGR